MNVKVRGVLIGLSACIVAFAAAPAGAAGGPPAGGAVTAYRVGKVVTMADDDRVINNAVVLVKDGKITALGKASEVDIPDGAAVVEMPDCWLTPGVVELHNHTAGALSDLNDMVYLTNPGLRTLDAVVPNSDDVKRAREGGVTTVLLIPGSGTNISGFGTAVKLGGNTADEVVVKAPASIKVAQAGNPEGYWYGVGRSFMNYNTRQTLEAAKAYHDAWTAFENGATTERPAFNPAFDDFRGLFEREFVASVHTQQYQVVMTTVDMLARKLKIRTVLDHSTFDGWKTGRIVAEVGEDNIITMVGPRGFFLDNTQRKIHGNVARWGQTGLKKIGINTDAPVIPEEELTYQGAMACWYGYEPYKALAGVTRIGAEAMMLEDRIGSIEIGKDADFGIWTGDPIDPRSACLILVIDGKIVRDAADGRTF